MIYIRADANEKVGTGHVMRCLSIANEIRKIGKEVQFIYADRRTEKIIQQHGFWGICLDSAWNDLNQEISKMQRIIQQKKIDFLLVDSYFVTIPYFNAIKKYVSIGYLDDLHLFSYPVDLLMNYNFYAKKYNYKEIYQRAGYSTLFLLGSLYVPLREEFQNVVREIKEKPDKILITSGGTDAYNILGNLLYELKKQHWFYQFEYYVVAGRFHKQMEELKMECESNQNIHLLVNIPNISDYMRECDLAVTAGGVTIYELCASGIPSIVYTMADNQLEIAQTVSEDGIIPWAGDIRNDKKDCIKNIIEQIKLLSKDVNVRKKRSAAMQKLVDGKGAQRFAFYLAEKFLV